MLDNSQKFLIFMTSILLLCVIIIEALFNYRQVRIRNVRTSRTSTQLRLQRARQDGVPILEDEEED